MTPNHEILTLTGWKMLSKLQDEKVGTIVDNKIVFEKPEIEIINYDGIVNLWEDRDNFIVMLPEYKIHNKKINNSGLSKSKELIYQFILYCAVRSIEYES